jgi:DNA-binding transcriptional MerR regulator
MSIKNKNARASSHFPLIPIGRFSRLTLLTIKALRFYDQIGLLCPVLSDPETGYRYYTIDQFEEAERIRQLRLLELPIETILELTKDNQTPLWQNRWQEKLRQHQSKLEAEYHKLERILLELRDMITEPNPLSRYVIELKTLPERWVAYLPLHLNLDNIESERERAVEELWQVLGIFEGTPEGTTTQETPERTPKTTLEAPLFHFPPQNQGEWWVEACLFLPEGQPPPSSQTPSMGRIRFKTLPGGHFISTVHTGDYRYVLGCHEVIARFLRGKGFAPEEVLYDEYPIRESYIRGPWNTPHPQNYLTEVMWQLPSTHWERLVQG